VVVDIQSKPQSIHDWDALGQTVGSRLPAHSVPVLTGDFAKPNAIQLKSFFAALACAAGTELCHMIGLTPEAPTLDRALNGNRQVDRVAITPDKVADVISSLNPNPPQKIDYISLGCPHYHIDEIRRIAVFLDGRKIHPQTILHIWTAGTIKYQADRCGYTDVIEQAGARILTGSCPSSRGYPAGVETVAYDSAKQRMSAEQETDAKLFYGSRQECLQSAISGNWEGR
jgi:predicted aconitase